MGRPLHKKYFGNRNIGTTGTSDNKIGGEGIASISNGTVGAIQINDTYKTFPYLTAAAPTLPGGVTADLSVTWEIAAIVISDDGSGYTINQTGASATLTGLTVQADVAPVVTINTDGSGNVSAISVAGGRGTFTDVDGTGITTWGIVGAGGTNAQATVTFRVKSIAVNEKGSGYVSAPALSWSAVNGGTMPSAQSVTLTTDSGLVGSSTNQENALLFNAKTTSGGTSKLGDVIKQQSSRRYKIKTADGTAVCKLVASATPAFNQCNLTATDSSGKTYWVTKITAHRALLTQYGTAGHEFATGTSVKWVLSGAVEDYSVVVANA